MEELKELKHLLQLVLQDNENLRTLNATLMARIGELEAQQKLNSQNSHHPPSQDKFNVPPKTGLPKAVGKEKGGQKDHKGDTLKMVSQADKIEECLPHKCVCGADLIEITSTVVERRQVFDIPSPRLAVTEYQRMAKVCRCGCVNTGDFPSEVKAPVQYGAGVMSFTTLLSAGFHLSYQHISQLFKDLYGYNLNEATSLENNNRCYALLEGAEQAIKAKILASPCVHFDETGINCSESSAWLHTSSTPQYTYQFVHSKRGGEALECSESLIPHFTHTAVHDCWSSYFHFNQCQHALCGAHLLRECNALIEQGRKWAKPFRQLLLSLYNASQKGLSKVKYLQRWSNLYDVICQRADKEEPPPLKQTIGRGKFKRTKGRNLLERLIKHKDAVLAFAQYEHIPFTNNQAERDIRPAKGKIKIAGVFRTFKGAKVFARTQAFISTIRKQNLNIFNELKAVFLNCNYSIAWNT